MKGHVVRAERFRAPVTVPVNQSDQPTTAAEESETDGPLWRVALWWISIVIKGWEEVELLIPTEEEFSSPSGKPSIWSFHPKLTETW